MTIELCFRKIWIHDDNFSIDIILKIYYPGRHDFVETHVEKRGRVNMGKLGFLGVNVGKDIPANTTGRVNIQNIDFYNVFFSHACKFFVSLDFMRFRLHFYQRA